MKLVFHNKFRMIIIHDQKALSLNFKSTVCRCFSKQVFLKILQYSQENTYGGFIKKRIQHRYFLVNIAKFRIIPILKNICKWLPLYILTDLELVIKYWADLILIKKITECFLLRRQVDLVRVYSLLIIRNHYNTFLLTNLQKTKTSPK